MHAVARMNDEELAKGVSGTDASWHAQYTGNAWVYAGGLSEELTEGDVLAVFSQYGEIEDLHLVRDKETGKSKGFAFLKYEDERSTILAVDNFNGATLLGKLLRVDHTDYRPPQKKMKEIQADAANGVAHAVLGAGHAYAGKDLKTGHDLDHGVNLFDNPASDPRRLAVQQAASGGNAGHGAMADGSGAPASAATEQDPMQGYVDDGGGRGGVAKRRRDDGDDNDGKREQKRLRKKAKKEAKKAKKAEKKAKKRAKKQAKKKAKKKAKKQGKEDQTQPTAPSTGSSGSGSSSSSDEDEDAQLRAAQAFLQAQQAKR